MWQKMLQVGSGGSSEPSIDLMHPDYFIGKQFSASGTAVNCGFRPRYIVMASRSSSSTASAVGLIAIDVEKNAVTNSWAATLEKEDIIPQSLVTDVTDTGFVIKASTYIGCFVYK